MKRDNKKPISTSIKLTKTFVNDLHIGMYVSKLDRPWLDTSFLFQGFELKTPEDIVEVQNQCDYVFVDVEKQRITRMSELNKPLKALKNKSLKYGVFSKEGLEVREPLKKQSDFMNEFSHAEKIHQESSRLIKSFMEEMTLGRAINVEIAKKAVSQCVQSIIKSPDALMWLTQLKNKDEYTSQHSMNVCILSIALGRQLGLSEAALEDLGLCGMMHDMGKMKIPLEILNKPGVYEPDELAVMQTHPTMGLKLLTSTKGMPGCAIDTAYTHHERLDGLGYPRGLTKDQIDPYTRMVTIADMYDAVASDRVYKQGKTHLETINMLAKASGTQLDSALVIKFIESLGIYPPGSIVEMSNGEIAVVIEVSQQKKLKPKITLLLNKNKQRVKPRLIDLEYVEVDDEGESFVIKGMVRAEEFDLDMNLLYKMNLIKDSLNSM